MAGLVHVTDMVNTRSFVVNGESVSAREALADFYRSAPEGVEDAISGKTLRVVNRGPLTDLEVRLASGDTIAIFESEVASGGVKGAGASIRDGC